MPDERPSGARGRGELPHDRRSNVALRELLDEMLQLTRHLTHQAAQMSPAELAYARERMEWLGDEIWDVATRNGAA